ncbi:hypothetical protein L3Q67_25800 [Saccharothrix sp. AJ9571]|nr:hypothetical protein L3Q67_25800 [Saccharothrix sp. AJ9571]
MAVLVRTEREMDVIRLPRWGRVAPMSDAVVPFTVLDADGVPVEPIARFLRDFVARGRRSGSGRSYAYALLRWWRWRWLTVIEVVWEQATSAEAREFVLWLQRTAKPRHAARTSSAATAGTVNAITGK